MSNLLSCLSICSFRFTLYHFISFGIIQNAHLNPLPPLIIPKSPFLIQADLVTTISRISRLSRGACSPSLGLGNAVWNAPNTVSTNISLNHRA
jgi:hypothetical protein